MLYGYVGGWLKEKSKVAFENHLKVCAKCNAGYVTLRNFTSAAKRNARKKRFP
jgi:hypothetical protein